MRSIPGSGAPPQRDERALKIYHHGTRVLIGFLVAVLGSPFGVRFVALPSLNNRVTWRCQMCSTLHVPLLKIPPGFPVPLRGTQQTSFVRSAPLVSIARAAGGTKGTSGALRTNEVC